MRRAAARLLRHLDHIVVSWLGRGFRRLSRGRLRPRLLSAGALVGATAVLVTAVWLTSRTAPVGAPETIPTARVGLAEGQSVPEYTAAASGELTSLLADPQTQSQEIYALVTMRAYLAPERLTPVLGGVTVAHVYARVPLVTASTQILRIPAVRIPDDVTTGMIRAAQRKDEDARNFTELAGKLSADDAEEARLRDSYQGDAAQAAAEATAFRDGCACVYAAVIWAAPVVLDQIRARSEVRAVDPAPEVRRLDRAVFLPPLPEQFAPAPAPSATGEVEPVVPESPSPEPVPSTEPPPAPSPSETPSAEPSAEPPSSPEPEPGVTASVGVADS